MVLSACEFKLEPDESEKDNVIFMTPSWYYYLENNSRRIETHR